MLLDKEHADSNVSFMLINLNDKILKTNESLQKLSSENSIFILKKKVIYVLAIKNINYLV